MTAVERDLSRVFGAEALRTGDAALHYLQDSTEMQGLRGYADAVVVPATTDDVVRLVTWCYDHAIPLVPRGGGTGFAGGAVPFGGVVCSLEALDRVTAFQPEFWRMQVEAGMVTARLHALARANGLLFAPDPGASEQSQLGGNVACNAGGPHSFKYGATGQWVLGLEAVTGTGDLVRFGGELRKDVAGYDLRGLLVGSEGTLGVVTRVWLKLLPAPERTVQVVAAYGDIAAGVRALRGVYAHGLVPATLEYLDGSTVALSRDSFPRPIDPATQFLVVSEADGSIDGADHLADELADALGPESMNLVRLESAADQSALRRWRSGVSYAVRARRGGKMSEDIAVPFEAIEDAIVGTLEIGARHGLEACSWGHAGDGNLHATFLVDAASPTDVARAAIAMEDLFDLARRLGGSVSGEHGLGWVKREQLSRQFGPLETQLHHRVKDVFDPAHILNPGKKGLGERTHEPRVAGADVVI